MKNILCLCVIGFCLASCGNGKKNEVINDTTYLKPANSTEVIGTGAGGADSTHGAMVQPLDTANSNKRKP